MNVFYSAILVDWMDFFGCSFYGV